MKKSLSTAVAMGAIVAAGLATSLANPALATTHHVNGKSTASAVTKFGMKANAVGTKVVVDNVELSSVKDAYAQQKCTRLVGRTSEVGSSASNANGGLLPIPNDLVKIAPSLSNTATYKTGGTQGVRAISTIASVNLGGTVAGVATPTLAIKGLQSTADAFHTAKGFDATSSFTYKGLALQLPQGNPVSDSLQTLFDALGVDPDQINDVIAVPVNTLVTTLSGLTNNLLTIPGLGSVKLGRLNKSVSAHSADASAYALLITIRGTDTANKTQTQLQLGRTESRITDGVRSGVFRSVMTALDLHIGDLLDFGSVRQRSLNCEGTYGKVVKKHVAKASVLGGKLVNMTGITYAYQGTQLAHNVTKGMVSTSIGRVEIPAVGLVVTGLHAQVDLIGHGAGTKVTRTVKASVGSIKLNGQTVAVPKPGQSTNLPDGSGVIAFQTVKKDDFFGTQVTALTLTLFANNSIIDLARATGSVWFK